MGAAVMLRSLMALRNVDAGFDPHNVLTMRVSLPDTRYAHAGADPRVLRHGAAAHARASRRPGQRARSTTCRVQGGSVQPIVLEGRAELLPSDQPTVAVRKITPGYLQAMNIPVLRGRDVADGDVEALLVSRGAAKLLWGDDDPIGRRVTLPLQSRTVYKKWSASSATSSRESSPRLPPRLSTSTRATRPGAASSLAMRTSGAADVARAAAAAAVVRALDPQQPVQDIRTMDAVLDETLTSQRFSALLLGLFASVALALASVGIYSVLSYIVRGRSREIGISTALGAQTGDVLRLVVIEGMTPAIIGIAVGAVAALGSATSSGASWSSASARRIRSRSRSLPARWRSWRSREPACRPTARRGSIR